MECLSFNYLYFERFFKIFELFKGNKLCNFFVIKDQVIYHYIISFRKIIYRLHLGHG